MSVTVSSPDPLVTGVPTSRAPTTAADDPPPAVDPLPPSSDCAWLCSDDGSWLSSAELDPESALADTPPRTTVPAIGARTVSAATVACAAVSVAWAWARCACANACAALAMPERPALAWSRARTAVLRAASYCACAVASWARAWALSVASGISSAAVRALAKAWAAAVSA